MIGRIDFGKPGDPSGCYMPREWWRPAPPAKLGVADGEAIGPSPHRVSEDESKLTNHPSNTRGQR